VHLFEIQGDVHMSQSKPNRVRVKYIQQDPAKIEGKYYRGRIAKFNPKTGYGFVETGEGSHIFFYADQIRLEGPQSRKSDIRPGKVVGFDVGWTDRGIRVSKMKIVEDETLS
jgi:cold shock CspA family protein